MRYISFLFLTLLFFSINSYNAQTTIEGVPFPSFTSINNKKVVLNGGGLREKYGFLDLYVGALYLKTSTKDADKIIMADEEMGIRIIIVSSMVTRERFIEALVDGFKNTTAGASNQSQINQFEKFYDDPFVEGDQIILNYVPGEGVQFYKNGKKRGVIEGLDFKQALFGIWLGGVPADDSLKEEMLGID